MLAHQPGPARIIHGMPSPKFKHSASSQKTLTFSWHTYISPYAHPAYGLPSIGIGIQQHFVIIAREQIYISARSGRRYGCLIGSADIKRALNVVFKNSAQPPLLIKNGWAHSW